MWEELHELLGGAAVITVSAVVLLGVALYIYPRLRDRLPVPRTHLVLLHRWGAVGFLFLAASHYLLAPHIHSLQPLGSLGMVAAFVLGWALRRHKRSYQFLVQTKAVLVLVGAVSLFAGHALLEDNESHREENHAAAFPATRYEPAPEMRLPHADRERQT